MTIARSAKLGVLAILVALAVGVGASVGAHGGEPVEVSAELRVAALVKESGTVEFGLIDADGERLLPELRFLNASLRESRAGRWLRSSPVIVTAGDDSEPLRTIEIEGRVNAMPRADGSVAFAVEVAGERYEPTRNILGVSQIAARANRWLRSTPVTVSLTVDSDHLTIPEPLATPDPPVVETPAEPSSEEVDSNETAPSGTEGDQPPAGDEDGDEGDEGDDEGGEEPAADEHYRIPDGPRAGVVADRNVIGDPDAPVLIRDVGDFL